MASVLIVEDDPWLADCYEKWLVFDGHVVRRVADAQAALDALDEQRSDIVLLDMLLPGASGVQLLHQLKSYPDFGACRVILCTAAGLPAGLDVKSYGVVSVLDKMTLTARLLQKAVATHAA